MFAVRGLFELESLFGEYSVGDQLLTVAVSSPSNSGASKPEFDILEQLARLIHLSSRCQGVEHPNVLNVFGRLKFACGMSFFTLWLKLER